MAPSIQNLISQRFAAVHHRQLFVIAGEEDWCLKQMEVILHAIFNEHPDAQSLLSCNFPLASNVHLPDQVHTGKVHASSTNNIQFKQHLGREYDFVIYNAWQGTRANALAALSGTIKKNGLMFLLCPSLNSWDTFKDPEISSRISFGKVEKFQQSLFIKHLINEIEQDKKTIVLDTHGLSGNNQKVPEELVQSPQVFHEQDELIEQIKKVSTGHTKRPLVITADRGRGKTAALGIALAQLLQHRPQSILVTAPQKNSVDTLFHHAMELLTNAEEHIKFNAVDDLILNLPQADMLVIDEAAGIPVQHLQRLTEHYNRIVFTTTVHGYEGSGRGFDIRFKPWLKNTRKDTKFRTLKQPIRWFGADCLEEFWWHALHLKPRFSTIYRPAIARPVIDRLAIDSSAEDAYKEAQGDFVPEPFSFEKPTLGELSFEKLTFEKISKQQLLENQTLLNAIFTLLIEAHYQTTPDDFVALLDSPDHHLFALFNGAQFNGACTHENLVGVVTGSIEGQFADDILSYDIIGGQRRVQGHMLPQQLAYASGEKTLLNYRYFRIIRIAVLAPMREMGIGSRLLHNTQDWCSNNNIEIIGSSFGVTEQLLRFWSAAEFAPTLLGFHKDKATAEFNITVVKTVDPDQTLIDLMQEFKAFLQEQFTFHLSDIYQELDNHIVCRLFQYFEQDIDEINNELSSNTWVKDTELLALYCNSKRSLELASTQIKRLLLYKIKSHKIKSPTIRNPEITTGQYDLLIDFLLKRIPLKQLLQKHDLKGKKHFQSTIKALTSKLLTI